MKIKIFLAFFFVVNIVLAREVSVMSYNVENLFDTVHDEGKDDWEYLPKNTVGKNDFCSKQSSRRKKEECLDTNWTDEKLKLKLEQISFVVKSKEPNLPDLLGLVEVENKNVLTMLGNQLGYKTFEMTESPDKRGVDVALFYKESDDLKKVSRTEHVVPVDYPTRNILEVRFLIHDKYYLTVFVNHWPSLQNPDSARVKAAETLKKRVDEILKTNPDESIIAMGDFNTIDKCDPHPFKTVLYKDNVLADVYDFVKSSPKASEAFKANLKSGTYYYPKDDQWNMLDHFFVNQNLLSKENAKIVNESFDIYSNNEMLFEFKRKNYDDKDQSVKIVLVPKRFKPEATTKDKIGFSDHFPIFVKLNFEKPAPVKVETKKEKTKSKKKK